MSTTEQPEPIFKRPGQGRRTSFGTLHAQLDEVTGIGATCAQELIAELGVDMTVFPTAAHLASWARFAPRANQSAGKTKPATTGKGNPWLASTLGEITAVLARSDRHPGRSSRFGPWVPSSESARLPCACAFR